MNDCKKIESLIYLYRKGELSAVENKKVLEHTKTCSRCQGIIEQLYSIDTALLPLREKVPDLSGDIALVDNTIDRIIKTNVQIGDDENKGMNLDVIFGWLRPALSFVVVAFTVLFVTQQWQDARKISELENQLQTIKGLDRSAITYSNTDAKRILGMVSSDEKKAGIDLAPLKMISQEIYGLFKKENGIFDYLSTRYPNLSSVTLDDGIDDRERKILSTEGKALMKEFEQFILEGDK